MRLLGGVRSRVVRKEKRRDNEEKGEEDLKGDKKR